MVVRRGVLKAFDSITYTADVQMAGSLSVWLKGLPVARNIPTAEMVASRRCAVIFFDEADPLNAVVVAVYT